MNVDSTVKAPKQIPPIMRVPPPLLFVVTFVVGAYLQSFARLTIARAPILHIAGFGLIACAVVLVLYSLGMFVAARTTVIPFSAASKLVTWGPYRFTRNPMYVGLVLVYLGIAAIRSELVAVILLLIPVILVHKIVIPFEEKRMREVFGDAFDQYCSRVRRWL